MRRPHLLENCPHLLENHLNIVPSLFVIMTCTHYLSALHIHVYGASLLAHCPEGAVRDHEHRVAGGHVRVTFYTK